MAVALWDKLLEKGLEPVFGNQAKKLEQAEYVALLNFSCKVFGASTHPANSDGLLKSYLKSMIEVGLRSVVFSDLLNSEEFVSGTEKKNASDIYDFVVDVLSSDAPPGKWLPQGLIELLVRCGRLLILNPLRKNDQRFLKLMKEEFLFANTYPLFVLQNPEDVESGKHPCEHDQ